MSRTRTITYAGGGVEALAAVLAGTIAFVRGGLTACLAAATGVRRLRTSTIARTAHRL